MKTSEIDDFLSVLSDGEIKSNCSICKRSVKVNNTRTASSIFKSENHFECKKCLMSISHRKYAFLYISEYLLRYNKKYFTVENIRRYVNQEFEHADEIVNSIAIVIRDLVSLGIVEIYSKQRNGHRYYVRDIEKIQNNEIAAYTVIKGFGFKDGVKLQSIASGVGHFDAATG